MANSKTGVLFDLDGVLLDSEGRQLSDVRGYDLSVEGFVDFLQKGLEEYAAR